jgi:hypothetical protein
VTDTHPSLITPTGAIDGYAVAAAISAGYRDRLDWINRYTGQPRRFWQKAIRQQVTDRVKRLASNQQCDFIFANLFPAGVPMTAPERRRLRALSWADQTIAREPGSINYDIWRTARTEAAVIRERASKRCYRDILINANRAEAERKRVFA